MRECTRCRQLLDESQFAERNDNPNRSDNLFNHCLNCQKIINRDSYERNKEARQKKARERKRAISAGSYTPDTSKGRQKRRVDLPPRAAPNMLLICHVDKHEQAFVEAEADRRGCKQEEVVREYIRAAMSAPRKKEEPN